MDGATSTGLWCNINDRMVSDPESVTVRNFVGVIPIELANSSSSRSHIRLAACTAFALATLVLIAYFRKHSNARRSDTCPRVG